MALIVDPDDLSQGGVTNVTDADFGAPSGETVTITSTANLPAMSAGDFFEVRDHSTAAFNGLYVETGGTPTTSSVTADKLSGGLITAAGDPAAEEVNILGVTGTLKNVMFDVNDKEIWLLEKGLLSVDGVAMIALHSFAKEEWKSDNFLIGAAGFPIVGISFAAGQWEIGVDPSGNFNGWVFADNIASPVAVESRRLVRNAGWDELNSAGITLQKYFNVTTLGSFEDETNDNAYYAFGTPDPLVDDSVDFEFAGSVNEPVRYFNEIGNPPTFTLVDGGGSDDTATRASGSFITDGFKVGGQVTIRAATTPANNGTFTLTSVVALTLGVGTGSWDTAEADPLAQVAVDNDNGVTCYVRVRDGDPEGKTFDQADLSNTTDSVITSKIIAFPLANATDLDITATDGDITGMSPWNTMAIRYFDQAFSKEIDGPTNRDFGIVVDVGTHSGVDGASTATILTSAEGGIPTDSTYTGGTITVHDGTPDGTVYTISGTPTATTVTITGTFDGQPESNLSFTLQRTTPIVASKNEIYEYVQHQLRLATDIDDTDQTVIGRTADTLFEFVGPTLKTGTAAPVNPNGGGSGVDIEGFDANDTNSLVFVDNTFTERTFPFVAAGTLVFNQGLVTDTDGEFWLFFDFTTRTTGSTVDCINNAGFTYDLTSDASQLGVYLVNDYLQISGFVQAENNGLFQVTVVNTSQSDYTVIKADGSDVGTTETNQTVNVDENPYPSPDAILVEDNSVADIVGPIGSTSIVFDFDYDNNVQGGRTLGTDALVVLVAAGLENSQVAVSPQLTISQATGLTFSLTSAQERNYSNP